jgi:hypothetical protein
MPDHEPLVRRIFRQPATGHEVALLVGHRGTSGGPRELLWRVWLEGERPAGPVWRNPRGGRYAAAAA